MSDAPLGGEDHPQRPGKKDTLREHADRIAMFYEMDIIDENEGATKALDALQHMHIELMYETLGMLDRLPLAVLRQIGEEVVPYVESEAATKLERRGFWEQAKDRVEWLLRNARDVSVHAVGPRGKTILMYAAASGRFELVKSLVARGAKIDARDDEGKTALMHAVLARPGTIATHSDELHRIVKFLVASGADVAAQDDEGMTSLDYARAGNPEAEARLPELIAFLDEFTESEQ